MFEICLCERIKELEHSGVPLVYVIEGLFLFLIDFIRLMLFEGLQQGVALLAVDDFGDGVFFLLQEEDDEGELLDCNAHALFDIG